jgi:uncharacterized membrane protein (UPF0127 family)
LGATSTIGNVSWLLRDGEVLATVERAESRAERRKGLLGRDGCDGVLRIETRSVHTFGMKFPIDIAVCSPEGEVLATKTLPPWRVTLPRLSPTVIYEAEAGTFRQLGLVVGDRLEERE